MVSRNDITPLRRLANMFKFIGELIILEFVFILIEEKSIYYPTL